MRPFLRVMRSADQSRAKQELYRGVISDRSRPVQVIGAAGDPALPLATYGEKARRAAGLDALVSIPGKHFPQEDQADILSIGHATFRLGDGGLRQEAAASSGPASAHEAVAAYWAAAEARDWAAFGALLTDDVIYRGPQTREQVRGRDAYVRQRSAARVDCLLDPVASGRRARDRTALGGRDVAHHVAGRKSVRTPLPTGPCSP